MKFTGCSSNFQELINEIACLFTSSGALSLISLSEDYSLSLACTNLPQFPSSLSTKGKINLSFDGEKLSRHESLFRVEVSGVQPVHHGTNLIISEGLMWKPSRHKSPIKYSFRLKTMAESFLQLLSFTSGRKFPAWVED